MSENNSVIVEDHENMYKFLPKGILIDFDWSYVKGSKLSPGEIFWEKKSGKLVKVLGTCCPINEEFLGKFPKLKIESFVNTPLIRDLINEFDKYSKLTDTKEKLESREGVIETILTLFLRGTSEATYVDFIHLFQTIFYELPEEVEEELIAHSIDLFQRSCFAAGLTVVSALMCGYVDFSYLKEIYNTTVMFEYAWTKDGVSSKGLEALSSENERQEVYLEENILEYPQKSGELLKSHFFENFKFRSVIELVKKHKERIDGSGFPKRINDNGLTDIEVITTFCTRYLSYTSISSYDESGNELLKDFFYGKMKDLIPSRLYGLISSHIEKSETKENDYLDIIGV